MNNLSYNLRGLYRQAYPMHKCADMNQWAMGQNINPYVPHNTEYPVTNPHHQDTVNYYPYPRAQSALQAIGTGTNYGRTSRNIPNPAQWYNTLSTILSMRSPNTPSLEYNQKYSTAGAPNVGTPAPGAIIQRGTNILKKSPVVQAGRNFGDGIKAMYSGVKSINSGAKKLNNGVTSLLPPGSGLRVGLRTIPGLASGIGSLIPKVI